MRFSEQLSHAVSRSNSLLCVGLDPDPRRIPTSCGSGANAIVPFNRAIVEATQDVVCAYKPNLGFYVSYGLAGIEALVKTRELIPPEIPVILDAKAGDFANTSAAYARGYFAEWGFDAITIQPYLGQDGLQPFLDYSDKGILVLAKTSNPGSGDLQDMALESGRTVYETVATKVNAWNQQFGNCGLVVGATYPSQLGQARALAPDLPILVPGIGAQGGDLEGSVAAGLDERGAGLIISASRGIIYAGSGEDYAKAARVAAFGFRDQINAARDATAAGRSAR